MDIGGSDPLDWNGTGRDFTSEVTSARMTLEQARSALDHAVAALPDVDGDEAMAPPALLVLLFGAMSAKERLGKLEALQASHFGEA